MKKLILSLFCGVFSFAQAQDIDANVLGSVEIGFQRYYMLQEIATGKYFKSELTDLDRLKYGDLVKIDRLFDSNGYQVVKDNLYNILFKAKELPFNDSLNIIQPNSDLILRLPEVRENMLYFSSFKQYYDVVELIEKYVDGTKKQIGSDFGLNQIEAYFNNFISFRKYYNTIFDSEINIYSSAEVDLIEKKDIVNNEIVKLLLNQNRLVWIEDKVYYYYDTDVIVSFYAKDFFSSKQSNNKLSQIKNINKLWEDLYSETPIISGVLLCGKDVYLHSNSHFISNTKALYQLNTTSPQYETLLSYKPVSCEPFKKNIFLNTYRYKWLPAQFDANGNQIAPAQLSDVPDIDPLNNQNAIIVVNWGDGTPNQTFNNYNNEFIQHTFITTGQYLVSTSLTYYTDEGQLITLDDQITVTVNSIVCTDIDNEEYGSIQTGDSNGDWKLAANVWAHDNLLCHEVGAYTHGWKKVNGSWKRKKSKIYVEVNGVFRDGNCVIQESKYEDDEENQERVDAEKFKLFKRYWSHSNSDVKSKHKLTKGSVSLELVLEIIFC
jgi:hypothetical protein